MNSGAGLSARGRLRELVQVSHGSWRGWWRSATAQSAYVMGALDRFTRPPLGRVGRLVFVCLGNINRSPFAEAVAARRGAVAVSFGLHAPDGEPMPSRTLQRAADHGIDLRAHVATDLSEYEFRPDDLLLVMETRHAQALIERGFPPQAIALLGHWSSPRRLHLQDPQTMPDAYFRSCFALVHSAVNQLIDELLAAGGPCVARSARSPR